MKRFAHLQAVSLSLVVILFGAGIWIRMDRNRRFQDNGFGFKLVFPLGWVPLSQNDPALRAKPDAYYGNNLGRSTAVFVHLSPKFSLEEAADNIESQAKDETGTVQVMERVCFERNGSQYLRLVFIAGKSGHHYTFVKSGQLEITLSSNCSIDAFQASLRNFHSIEDSLSLFPAMGASRTRAAIS